MMGFSETFYFKLHILPTLITKNSLINLQVLTNYSLCSKLHKTIYLACNVAFNIPKNHIQKDIKLFHTVSPFVFGQFSLVAKSGYNTIDNTLSFCSVFIKTVSFAKLCNPIQNLKHFSQFITAFTPFHEVFVSQSGCNISTIFPITQFTHINLCNKEEMDEHLGTLLSFDPDVSSIHKSTIYPLHNQPQIVPQIWYILSILTYAMTLTQHPQSVVTPSQVKFPFHL